MKKITNFLQGKKTYIVVIVAIVFNTLVQYGVIDPSYTQYVNIVLSALGLGTLRAGINKV
jgi:capsular polysaccharide biosynthesis protein